MSGNIARCCPCCEIDSCLYGDTIDTGCCIGCEDLIMWSERPGFEIQHKHFLRSQLTCYAGNITAGQCDPATTDVIIALGAKYNCIPDPKCANPACDPACWTVSECPSAGCDSNQDGVVDRIGKIMNYRIWAEELDPVQTVYKFEKTYWRPVGLYSGGYPVHNGVNTHRSVISTQLPVAKDPIKDGEFITPLLSRCKFETIDDSPKMYWWQSTFLKTYMRTCLGGESPCATGACDTYNNPINCTPQEEYRDYCDTKFILDPDDILIDLKRGYSFSNLEFSGNNCCYPICADPPCNQVTNFPFCECDSYWMTRYRRRKLLDDYRYTWGADIECYNDIRGFENPSNAFSFDPAGHSPNYKMTADNQIGKVNITQNKPSGQSGDDAFRLADHWLFNMAYERWWKIAKDDAGISQVYWDTPGSSGANPNPSVGNTSYPYQVDDLVPKWWIYACSGVPFFQFELEDAFNPMNGQSSTPRPKINDTTLLEEFELKRNEDLPYGEYDLQDLWKKLANLGYFDSKDWRAEQLQAYKDLNQRFPNAGYQTYANKTVDDMPLLGPFRKKYYANHSMEMRKPFLRPELVPRSARPLQAECYIDYPGLFPTPSMSEEEQQQAIDDYYYWAERQWVYFRGVPYGWTWANWNAQTTCPCCVEAGWGFAPNEDAAILAGCGRAAGNCIQSWFNAPQESFAQDNAAPYTCYSYDGEGCQECQEECVLSDACLDLDSEACKQCYSNCLNGVCKVSHEVPQCNVTGGIKQAAKGVDGTPFQCQDISCLNCCEACAKEIKQNYSIKIYSVQQITNTNNFKFSYLPNFSAGKFGGEEATDTDFLVEVGDKISFNGLFHSNPETDINGDTIPDMSDQLGNYFLTPPYEVISISSNNSFIIQEPLFDSSSVFYGGYPVTSGQIIFSGTVINDGNLGDASVERVTAYYCDDSTYDEFGIVENPDFSVGNTYYSCEEYNELFLADATCAPKTGLLGGSENCGCAATPLIGCPEGVCRKLSITSYCQGIHIIATQYAAENKLEWGAPECDPNRTPLESINSYYRCLWSAHTFLTSAQNFYKFINSINECVNSSDTSMRSFWPEVKNTHIIPQKSMCNPHYAAITGCSTYSDEQYQTLQACDGGVCWPWYSKTTCCDATSNCPPILEGNEFSYIYCLQRMPCVNSTLHGKIWPAGKECPPSLPERDDFLEYTPSCI